MSPSAAPVVLALVLACQTHEAGFVPAAPPSEAPALPERPATLPVVDDQGDVARLHGQWAEVQGTLTASPPGKPSPASPSGTVLTLADGTRVRVRYGEPPEGWEPWVGRSVRVAGIVWNGPSPDLIQYALGAHLSHVELLGAAE